MRQSFKSKHVVIMGLGLHGGGAGAARFFVKQGAKVLVTDRRTREQLASSIKSLAGLPVAYTLGRHLEQDFIKADIIVKNPGVPASSPYLALAQKHGVAVTTDIAILLETSSADIIGVTGTKGKSTTATLLYHMLKKAYPRAYLAGNIGGSVLDNSADYTKGSKLVLELSSFELESLRVSPHIAVITNLLPDHLDRYKTFAAYCRAKKPIIAWQKSSDIVIANYDNANVQNFVRAAPGRVRFFSCTRKPRASQEARFGCFVEHDAIRYNGLQTVVCDIADIPILGQHVVYNVLAAATAARVMGVSFKSIREAITEFKGVPHRLEDLGELRGIRYINDTAATMPDAMVAALKAIASRFPSSNIVLIAGGQNKNLSYAKAAAAMRIYVRHLVLLPGTASEVIAREVLASSKKKAQPQITRAAGMKEAVVSAAQLARQGDVVLLSPGAASFNLFANEFDRGEQFREAVRCAELAPQQ